MLTADTDTTTDTQTPFPSNPDVSETFARTVDAPLGTVEGAARRLDLIGPLVRSLIAIGLGDHIVTPCSNGLVWRFDPSGNERIRLAWSVATEAETDDASLVTLTMRVSASDNASRARLLEAWPVLGPIVELHARRILHSVDALAEETAENPFKGSAIEVPQLRAV
jgi:hypothetical protein